MKSIYQLENQHLDVDSKIAAALERLSQGFRVLLWEKTKNHNLSPIQIQMLVFLYFHTRTRPTVSHLSREFGLTPATVSDAITTLEKKQLVRREGLKTDRRVILINLTLAGKKTAKKLSTWSNVIYENIEKFDDHEKPVVLNFMMQLLNSLSEAGIISVNRMCISCKYFQPNPSDTVTEPHYCNLIQKPLAISTMRFDCAEHVVKS